MCLVMLALIETAQLSECTGLVAIIGSNELTALTFEHDEG